MEFWKENERRRGKKKKNEWDENEGRSWAADAIGMRTREFDSCPLWNLADLHGARFIFFFFFSSRLSRELRNSIENPRLYWNGTKRLFVPFISFRRVKKVTTHNINETKVPNPQLQRILRTPGREEKKRNGHQRMKRCDGCVLSLTRRISACCRRPPERINRPKK